MRWIQALHKGIGIQLQMVGKATNHGLDEDRLRQAMQRPLFQRLKLFFAHVKSSRQFGATQPKRLSTLSDGLADCCEPFKIRLEIRGLSVAHRAVTKAHEN